MTPDHSDRHYAKQPSASHMPNFRFPGARGFRSVLFATALMGAAAAALAPAAAQIVQRIAAVVNDEVISGYDLDQRLGLVVATAGVQPTPENIERIRGQVLRALVDERLQIQEATENNIEIEKDRVDEAIERIGARNNMSLKDIEGFLSSVNVSIDTLRSQVYAELAWNELVQSRFGPRVTVTESEIDTVLERIQRQSDQPSYRVSEIFLSVESPDEEAQVKASAESIVAQLRQGTDIRPMASQFSQAPTAANGGDVGWVLDGQLPDDLNSVLRRMQPGDVSDPIRTVGGYYIFELQDRRLSGNEQDPMDAVLTLEAVSIPFTPDMTKAELKTRGDQVKDILAANLACGQVENYITRFEGANFRRLNEIPLRSLPPAARQPLLALSIGQWGQPQRTPQGIELVVLCGKEIPQQTLPSRDEIENQLFNQELSMMSRRYLRDLRRSAVVEMR